MGKTPSMPAGKLLIETIIVVTIAVIGYTILQTLIIVAANFFYYGNFQTDRLLSILYEHLNLLKILQAGSSIILFILPSLYISNKYTTYVGNFGFWKPKTSLFAWVILMYIISLPLIQFLGEWNKNIQFPTSFSHIEGYLKNVEYQAEVMTKEMLKGTHWSTLLINLIVVAILPAICEEVFFRGILQKIFIKISQNTHIAIWITAFIFSAIHMQFYGFFARFLLGIILGYLYFYGKNIWYNISYHFINNGVITIVYFVMNVTHKNVDDLDKNPPINTWYVFLVALLALIFVLRIFKRKNMLTNPA